MKARNLFWWASPEHFFTCSLLSRSNQVLKERIFGPTRGNCLERVVDTKGWFFLKLLGTIWLQSSILVHNHPSGQTKTFRPKTKDLTRSDGKKSAEKIGFTLVLRPMWIFTEHGYFSFADMAYFGVMKKRYNLLSYLFSVVVAAAFFYTLTATESPEDYIEKDRGRAWAAIYNLIRFNNRSPAHRFNKSENLKSCSFFPIEPTYRS